MKILSKLKNYLYLILLNINLMGLKTYIEYYYKDGLKQLGVNYDNLNVVSTNINDSTKSVLVIITLIVNNHSNVIKIRVDSNKNFSYETSTLIGFSPNDLSNIFLKLNNIEKLILTNIGK